MWALILSEHRGINVRVYHSWIITFSHLLDPWESDHKKWAGFAASLPILNRVSRQLQQRPGRFIGVEVEVCEDQVFSFIFWTIYSFRTYYILSPHVFCIFVFCFVWALFIAKFQGSGWDCESHFHRSFIESLNSATSRRDRGGFLPEGLTSVVARAPDNTAFKRMLDSSH